MSEEISHEQYPLGVRLFKESLPIRFPEPDSISTCDKCGAPITRDTFNVGIDDDLPYCTTYALCGKCITLFKINKLESQ